MAVVELEDAFFGIILHCSTISIPLTYFSLLGKEEGHLSYQLPGIPLLTHAPK